MSVWAENNREWEYDPSPAEIAVEFWRSRFGDMAVDSWPLTKCLSAFMADRSGDESIPDRKEFFNLYAVCRETWPSKDDRRLRRFHGRILSK